jgi:hypothetical protein
MGVVLNSVNGSCAHVRLATEGLGVVLVCRGGGAPACGDPMVEMTCMHVGPTMSFLGGSRLILCREAG